MSSTPTDIALDIPARRGSDPDPYGLTLTHWGRLRTVAHNAAWVHRAIAGAEQLTVGQVDRLTDAALRAVRTTLIGWHEQDPRRHPATRPLPLGRGDGDTVRVTLQVVVDLPVDGTPERTIEVADERVHAALEEGVGLDLVDVTVVRADGP